MVALNGHVADLQSILLLYGMAKSKVMAELESANTSRKSTSAFHRAISVKLIRFSFASILCTMVRRRRD